MRDLAGFAILVLILVVGFYFLFQVLFPFLMTYLLGLIVFFLGATAVVWKGRLHPIHLDSLLSPGYPLILGLLSVAVPLAHAMVVFLFSDVDHWLVIFAVNVTIPVLWTSRLLVVHGRQKAQYYAEGHDIEDLLDTARRRETALEVKIDAMDSVEEHEMTPEPWESAVGVAPTPCCGDDGAVSRTRERIMSLRDDHAEIVRDLVLALSEARSTAKPPPHPAVERSGKALDGMEEDFTRVMREAESQLSDSYSGVGAPGWEE